MRTFIVILFFSIFYFSCSVRTVIPDTNTYTLSDTIAIGILDNKNKIDTVYISSPHQPIRSNFITGNCVIPAEKLSPGVNNLSINATLKSGRKIKREFKVFIISNIIPKKYIIDEIGQIPHDTSSFTQGLLYYNDHLYESTGIKGKSKLRIINPENGRIVKDRHTDKSLFNEGISIVNDTLFQLTWKDSVLVIYSVELNEITRAQFPTEGWGLYSTDGILGFSDGSNRIMRMNPATMDIIDTLRVIDDKGPVYYINEMEWVDGYIWANIYGKDEIAVIHPTTGKVVATLLAENLIDRNYYKKAGVMNGIAYDPTLKRVFLTGKNWPFIKVCNSYFGE